MMPLFYYVFAADMRPMQMYIEQIALVRHIRLSISFFHHLSDKFSENWEELWGCFQILMIGLLWPKSIDSIGRQSMQQLSM